MTRQSSRPRSSARRARRPTGLPTTWRRSLAASGDPDRAAGDVDSAWRCEDDRSLVTRLVDAQAGWARPFGDFNHRWLSALFGPIRPIKDFLNGTWLGPPGPLRPDRRPDRRADSRARPRHRRPAGRADVALLVAVLSIVAAAVAGLADYTDTDGTARMRATVHAVLMTASLVLFAISLVIRAGNPADRAVAVRPRSSSAIWSFSRRRRGRRRPRLPHRDPRQPACLAGSREEVDRP